jgi:hypothetical protein
MTNHPAGRLASGPDLADKYASNETLHKSLQTFVNDPAVRALLALGGRATVRYYTDSGFGSSSTGGVQVAQIYAVTYHPSPNDEPTTFFVQLALEKVPGDLSSPGGWRVLSHKGGDVLPKP